MAFTAQELANIANATLDYHIKDGILDQSIQAKPLLKAMKAAQKTFPGGKELITKRVKFTHSVAWQGYTHDDSVGYSTPANVKQASYDWKELHGGIKITGTDLKIGGISVVDSLTGERTSLHSEAEKIQLANLLDDKIQDMTEGLAEDMNEMFWLDGTQDATEPQGIPAFIHTDPTAATLVGGIDQSVVTLWRNRARLNIVTTTPSDCNVSNALQDEYRQLIRYGGKPNLFLAGSDFIEAYEKEARAKGYLTQTGWADKGSIDMSIGDSAFKGQMIKYDPTLDDLGKAKYGYWIDTKAIYPMVMDGEDMKRHFPARDETKYVYYQAMTWTGNLVCWRRNSSLVITIA